MRLMNLFRNLVGPLLVVVAAGVAWQTRDTWKDWLVRTKDADDDDAAKAPHSDHAERVIISEQAQRNLRLVVKEANLTTYWRKIYLPGTVVDRPGHSDRGIPAPISGVVISVNGVPGKTVRPGDELFRLRLVSESFQSSQMELFKSVRELEIVQKERKRLESIPSLAVPTTRLLELQYQEDRHTVLIKAHRQDLQTRQLTREQIADVEKGLFVTEVIVRMPERAGHAHGLPTGTTSTAESKNVEYEIQELKVNLGDHVQAGQILAYVADHRRLYVEGRALKQETQLLAKAAKEGWPVEAEFSEAEGDLPAESLKELAIEYLGPTMDASGLTLPVYVPFENPVREYKIRDRVYRAGLHRPGQKVLLKVAVAKMADVFVLPTAAVVREGPEAYVFRQNGIAFDRRPVHVLYEDFDHVVIANDGSILPGVHYLAQNSAAALNRVLKASQAEGGGGHHHDH